MAQGAGELVTRISELVAATQANAAAAQAAADAVAALLPAAVIGDAGKVLTVTDVGGEPVLSWEDIPGG